MAALERGITLKDMVTAALEQELRQAGTTAHIRVEKALVRVSSACPILRLKPAQLARIEAETHDNNS